MMLCYTQGEDGCMPSGEALRSVPELVLDPVKRLDHRGAQGTPNDSCFAYRHDLKRIVGR